MKKEKTTLYLLRAIIVIILTIGLFFALNTFSSMQENRSSVVDILKPDDNTDELKPYKKSVKLIAVGDIMLSRGVDMRMSKMGNDYPFQKISNYLDDGDIVFGNLESPIAPGDSMPWEGTVFRARPGVEKSLKNAGFNVISLANNHMGNQGQAGVKFTINALRALGINTIGAGKDNGEASNPTIITKKGLKFAFLAYTDGTIIPKSYEAEENNYGVVYMDESKLAEDVAKAKKVADFVIVSMHAGIEYTYRPNQNQINFAHKAIDSGADLVIGHHPHQIQDIEKYKEKYIFYSLGNFIFDQEWSKETKQGFLAEIYFNENGVFDYNLIPVLIEDYSQPDIMNDDEAIQLFRNIKRP
ncbi:CapA family protein [bacterium]|nr:CapA family protein [bacterium]